MAFHTPGCHICGAYVWFIFWFNSRHLLGSWWKCPTMEESLDDSPGHHSTTTEKDPADDEVEERSLNIEVVPRAAQIAQSDSPEVVDAMSESCPACSDRASFFFVSHDCLMSNVDKNFWEFLNKRVPRTSEKLHWKPWWIWSRRPIVKGIHVVDAALAMRWFTVQLVLQEHVPEINSNIWFFHGWNPSKTSWGI